MRKCFQTKVTVLHFVVNDGNHMLLNDPWKKLIGEKRPWRICHMSVRLRWVFFKQDLFKRLILDVKHEMSLLLSP